MTSRPVALARGLLTAALVWGVGSLLTLVVFHVVGTPTTIAVAGQTDRAQIVWWGAHAFFACLGGLLGVAIGGISLTRERLARPGAATSALGVPILTVGGAVLMALVTADRMAGDLAFACAVGLLTGVVGGAVYVLQTGVPGAEHRYYPAAPRAGQSWGSR